MLVQLPATYQSRDAAVPATRGVRRRDHRIDDLAWFSEAGMKLKRTAAGDQAEARDRAALIGQLEHVRGGIVGRRGGCHARQNDHVAGLEIRDRSSQRCAIVELQNAGLVGETYSLAAANSDLAVELSAMADVDETRAVQVTGISLKYSAGGIERAVVGQRAVEQGDPISLCCGNSATGSKREGLAGSDVDAQATVGDAGAEPDVPIEGRGRRNAKMSEVARGRVSQCRRRAHRAAVQHKLGVLGSEHDADVVDSRSGIHLRTRRPVDQRDRVAGWRAGRRPIRRGEPIGGSRGRPGECCLRHWSVPPCNVACLPSPRRASRGPTWTTSAQVIGSACGSQDGRLEVIRLHGLPHIPL